MTSNNTTMHRTTSTKATAAAGDKRSKEELLKQGMPQIQKFYGELFDDQDPNNANAIEDRVSNDDFYPKFQRTEVQLGKVLGKGGFAIVYEIKAFELEGRDGATKVSSSRDLLEDDEKQVEQKYLEQCHSEDAEFSFQTAARSFLSQHCFRVRSGKANKKQKKKRKDARYACKVLAASTTNTNNNGSQSKDCSAQQYLQGILDIAVEARFLSSLQHRNIVKCKGMARGNLFHPHYFLVLDRLYHTLDHRLYKVWAPKQKMRKSLIGKMITDRHAVKRNSLWEERLVYAWDLSTALTYLHSRKIIYRDLKPENVGFDCRDDIKLFDFGLSRPLKDHLRVSPDSSLYKLTAHTGSPRYMAPEVAWGKPYNPTCDTYSFCILLWEMLALQRPFEVYSMTKMKQRVWGEEAKRPPLGADWSLPLRLLLQKGWAVNPLERSTMEQVEEILQQECIRITGGPEPPAGMAMERRESDTSLVFQKQRGKSFNKTFFEQYQEFEERGREEEEEEEEPTIEDSSPEGEDDEDGSNSLAVGDEKSNLPNQKEEDWWAGGVNPALESIVMEALGDSVAGVSV